MGRADILVFTPPAPENQPHAVVNYKLGEICGWLRDKGYEFDQRSLFVECRYFNRHRFREDLIDLSVFEPDRAIEYLKGGEDEDIECEARRMSEMLSLESYEVIVLLLGEDRITSTTDAGFLMALPVLEKTTDEQVVVVGGLKEGGNEGIARLPYIDYVVEGGLELPLANILSHELRSEPLQVEPGIMCERGGELERGMPYNHPMEGRAKPYFEPDILEKCAEVSLLDDPIIPYKLSAGCSQNCSFCTYFENQEFQYKSADKAVSEIRELTEEFGTEYVRFEDQNLFSDPEHIKEIAVRMQEEGMDVSWTGRSIIVSRSQEFFDTLAEGGCTALYHGIESASDDVLHRMQKHQTREIIEDTLRKEHRAGIKPFAGLITDYVDESWDEYRETVDFVRENPHLMSAEVSSLRVYPSERQALYRDPEEFGIEILEEEWDEWRGIQYNYNLPFRDSRGEMGTVKERRREMKEKHLQGLADRHLFLSNFGTRHPLTFLRMQLRKVLTKNYTDLSYQYV